MPSVGTHTHTTIARNKLKSFSQRKEAGLYRTKLYRRPQGRLFSASAPDEKRQPGYRQGNASYRWGLFMEGF